MLIDRAALASAQAEGDVMRGHELLLDAFNTDVRPLCANVRAQLGAAADPIAHLRASGYAGRMARERAGAPGRDGRATAPAGLGVSE
jgi:L-rhamnose isomerase/sugar isomerase